MPNSILIDKMYYNCAGTHFLVQKLKLGIFDKTLNIPINCAQAPRGPHKVL